MDLSTVVTTIVAAATAEDTSTGALKTGNPIYDALLSFGPIGVVLLCAAMGYIWFKPSVDALREDKRLLQEVNTKLIASYEEKALPALQEAVKAMSLMAEAVSASRAEVVQMRSDFGYQLHGQKEEISALKGQIGELTDVIRQLELRMASGRGGTP